MAKFTLDFHEIETVVEVTRAGDHLHVSSGEITAELRLIRQEDSSFVLAWPQEDGAAETNSRGRTHRW